MGLFSKDSFKIKDGACTVSFEKSGELTRNRVKKIFDSPKVRACHSVNVRIEKKITSIGDTAFFDCTNLTSVAFSNSVTSIGKGAFENCTRLDGIVIPNGVSSIGDSAFENCARLERVIVSDSVASIGIYAFDNCIRLQSIEIPKSVTSIGVGAFENCPRLMSITVKDGNTSYKSIDGSLYSYDGKGLIKYAMGKQDSSFEIPMGVMSIGARAFVGCERLTSIKIPDSVVAIGDFAFAECDNLTVYCEAKSEPTGWSSSWNPSECAVVWRREESQTLRKRVLDEESAEDSYKIENNACLVHFSEQGEITKERVRKIFDLQDVAGCKEIKVKINKNVTGIDFWAFQRIDNLTSVEISSDVTNICEPPFSHCRALTSITVDEGNEEYKSIDGNLYTKDGKTLVQYAAGKKDKHFAIPKGVTKIGASAFCLCQALTSVEIPDTVTSIEERAFGECTGITDIKIPAGVTSIGDNAFNACTSLTSVEMPSTVTSIGDGAFSHCGALSKIEIPSSVTMIGVQAFYLCSSLENVEIPSGVRIMGKNAFFDCKALKIYTEIESQPNGWSEGWNSSNRPVFWNAKKVLLGKFVTILNPKASVQGLLNSLIGTSQISKQELLKALLKMK